MRGSSETEVITGFGAVASPAVAPAVAAAAPVPAAPAAADAVVAETCLCRLLMWIRGLTDAQTLEKWQRSNRDEINSASSSRVTTSARSNQIVISSFEELIQRDKRIDYNLMGYVRDDDGIWWRGLHATRLYQVWKWTEEITRTRTNHGLINEHPIYT